jgi:hypothetical protein
MESIGSSYEILRMYAVVMDVDDVILNVVHQDQTMRVDIKETNRTTAACFSERLQPSKTSVICRDRRGNRLDTLTPKGLHVLLPETSGVSWIHIGLGRDVGPGKVNGDY